MFQIFSLGQDPDNFSQDLLCDCLLVFSKLICIYLGLDLNLNFSRISMRLYTDSSKLIFLHGSRCEFDFFSRIAVQLCSASWAPRGRSEGSSSSARGCGEEQKSGEEET